MRKAGGKNKAQLQAIQAMMAQMFGGSVPTLRTIIGEGAVRSVLPSATVAEASQLMAEMRKGVLVMFICNHCPFVKAVIDRIVRDCRELADVTAREHGNIHRSAEYGAAAIGRLLDRCDAWRRPERFGQLLLACECDARGRLGFENAPYPQGARLLHALALTQAVDTEKVAAAAMSAGLRGPAIGQAVARARAQALDETQAAIEAH